MKNTLKIYNSYTGEKTDFEPIHEGRVGMYVCGPTVYSDVHLGNCRSFTSFDVVYRYLKYLGYNVRYVRNITDVGHLEGDADIGREDKIAKKARLEQIEPMEVVQQYTIDFHNILEKFNCLPPSIEPTATGGPGLSPSPEGTLEYDTPYYVDYLNADGLWIGSGGAPTPGTVYIRRWAVDPLPTNPGDTLVLRVLTTTLKQELQRASRGAGGPRGRLTADSWMVSVKTRKAL